MKNIVILISGRGSNMEAIVQACAQEGWLARIAAVISNRPDAAGLTRSYDVRTRVAWSSHEPNSMWLASAIFARDGKGA